MHRCKLNLLAVGVLLYGLTACAPHSSSHAVETLATSAQSPVMARVSPDWCFMTDSPSSTDPPRAVASERIQRGFDWLSKARLTGDPGDVVQAAACADLPLVAESDPVPLADDPEVNLLRVQVLLSQHAFARARDYAQLWTQQADAPPIAHVLLSDALLELGDIDGATAALAIAMQARPDQNAYARAAHLRWLRGDIEGAKRIYADVLQNRDPSHPEPTAQRFLELAKLVQIQGDLDGAKALVQAGLAAMPGHRDSLIWLANVALDAGHADVAATLLARLEAGLVDIPVLALKRRLALLQQDRQTAAAIHQQIESQAKRGEGWAYAQYLLARNEAPVTALSLIKQERATRDGLAFDAAEAEALWQLGQTEAALQAIERALRYQTPEPNWLSLRADILLSLGRTDAASETRAAIAAIQVLAPKPRLAANMPARTAPISARSQ